MTVNELSRKQLIELKGHYLMFDKNGEQDVSYDDFINADTLVSDETVKEYYQDFSFTEDDFTLSNRITINDVRKVIFSELASGLCMDNCDATRISDTIAEDVLRDALKTSSSEPTSSDISMAFHRLLLAKLIM